MAGNGVEGVCDVAAAWGAGRSENKVDNVDTSKEAVNTLLKALDEAQKTFKNQTVQDLRDKLNEKRKELGDEKFKAILEQLRNDASQHLLMLLKALFPELFASERLATPSPTPIGNGNVNQSNFGSVKSMTNKPFTEGAGYTDYKPDKSNPGRKPGTGNEADNIWAGFKQGPDGNCTTVAVIKTAMMQFGKKPTDVFRDVKTSGDGYDVQMRDGFQLHLSKGELAQAAQQARFEGTDPEMMTNANFMYAASAKRAYMEGNEGRGNGNDHNAQRSYMDALVSLNDGELPDEVLNRLGLKGLYRQSSSDELASGALGVVAYDGHTMAVIGGKVELWGAQGGQPKEEDWYWGGAYAFV
ncbi:hypothetical protein SAMN04515675_2014 [Pseudomonas costantinii]|uniref:Uncharacterized protein n=2 Tax=Pseudomonas costantinii TaxID=168469 RepID=A0A1H5CN38_9PSED|nr:hypothetical protein SAMN04515675_2014 [Pseudomonas costantinii]